MSVENVPTGFMLKAWTYCMRAYSAPTIVKKNAQAYTVWGPSGVLNIAVAGTNDLRDVKNDARFWNVPVRGEFSLPGKVGLGFVNHTCLLQKDVMKLALTATELRFYGHSLAGPVAELLARWLYKALPIPVLSLVTFGAPPGGTKEYATELPFVYYRMTQKGDPVPALGQLVRHRVHSGRHLGDGAISPWEIHADYMSQWARSWFKGHLAVTQCHGLESYKRLVT